MKLLPVDNAALTKVASRWLESERNYQWLDFGNGVQNLNPATVAFMVRRKDNYLWAFTEDEHETPIGITGLTGVKQDFRTATAWIVLGEKRYCMKGYARRAGALMLTLAFRELGLNSVDVWCASCNHASLRLIRQLNFKPIGVQRRCHIIDGNVYDRLWFDLLAEEHLARECA